jgi:hypothetical protein
MVFPKEPMRFPMPLFLLRTLSIEPLLLQSERLQVLR